MTEAGMTDIPLLSPDIPGKNVVIFSDGTGQAGGFRFDENRSNIYKLYRATRCGPDSSTDPREQVAFYDPGLGSQADGGHLTGRLFRWVHNTVAQATGFGITRNIIDCYAALIQLWRPGDRIFLFGFSRGAYTVRCLAGVIAHCGIPTHPAKQANKPLKINAGSAQKLAAYAVKHVYQFTYPRKKADATSYQQFLLDTREKLADQFREDYGSAAAGDPKKANVYPHFIGVFDTVAALGNSLTFTLFSVAFLAFAAGLGFVGWLLTQFDDAPLIGWMLAYLTFRNVFWGAIIAAATSALASYVFTHFKWDFSIRGYRLRDLLRTIHFNELWMKFYDCDLNPNVGYARHALSIDENRKNFQRVKWFSVKDTDRDRFGIQWFEQVWFAGNHSDIGGSYPENEARLSDIALDWILSWARVVPHGLHHDPRVLKLSPYPEGVQHDEVKVGFGLVTKYLGWSWTEEKRILPNPDAIMHRSVYERFDLEAVPIYDEFSPYRPTVLAKHNDFSAYYQPSAPFPAKSLLSATALADEPRAGTKTP
jgi:uncharacterized protein (DUF2235 family)